MNFRDSRSGNIVLKIVLINVIIYIFQQINPFLYLLFSLIPIQVVEKHMYWQFATYMFLHGGFLHIFFNMYILIVCGSTMEGVWGGKKFLFYYFFCGIGAGLSIFVLNYFTGLMGVPTLGASGAIFGVLVAFAIYFPDARFFFMFIFPMKAIHMVFLLIAVELYFLLNGGQAGISNIGHVGGFIFGLIFLVFFDKDRSLNFIKNKKNRKKVEKLNRGIESEREVFKSDSNQTKNNILSKLQKGGGIDSLTDDEFQFIRYIDIMVEPVDLDGYEHDSEKEVSDELFISLVKKHIEI